MRHPASIARLWAGLVAYATQRGYRYFMGCASLSMADGGHVAAGIYRSLIRNFNTADLLMLPLSRMDARYARHFMNG